MRFIIYFIVFLVSCNISQVIGHETCVKHFDTSKLIHQKLLSLLKKRDPVHSDNFKIIIKNIQDIKITCDHPKIILSPHSPMWGRINAIITCNKHRQSIQFDLQMYGKYFIAKQYLIFGKNISLDDLTIVTGRLDTLSSNICLNINEIINNVTSRNIQKNEPIVFSMFHKPWLVKIYQRVAILIKGCGFTIMSEGKALSNAFYNDKINIALDNGKIIAGVVNANGKIIISN
ncbi:Flagella basal body P-ring formation protein FlgA [Buchnera aphidicola (Eriosoma grossulariae)]|uniref:flagellar basal body P-ring formation chaperone FlgA n=1 Tax=Buchnera aphidicola TaxID=9 RepID=UPI0034644223